MFSLLVRLHPLVQIAAPTGGTLLLIPVHVPGSFGGRKPAGIRDTELVNDGVCDGSSDVVVAE